MTIELRGVSVRAGGRTIVHDVSLHVPDGEVVALVGPNGSGKSTLLKTVYAGRARLSGTVRVGALDVDQASPQLLARRLAVVAQDAPTDFPMTVESMVGLGRLPHRGRWGGNGEADRAAVGRALRRAGVAHLRNRDMWGLSGGERQRVLLARALAQEADHLVLDEPTNHLDVRAQLELLGLIRSLGVTTLIVLHDLNLAASHCDHLAVLNRGRVVARGRPRDVVTPNLASGVFGVRAVLAPVEGAPQLLFPPIDNSGDPEHEPHRATTRNPVPGRRGARPGARGLR